MNTLAPSETNSSSSQTDVVTPVSPRPLRRQTGYSEEMVGRLCEVIRRRGLADAAAAQSVGISRVTLWRWKQDHAELEDWLAMAREQYRDAKLAIVDEAKTPDGQPDWRAAAWALAKAFPADYGRGAAAGRDRGGEVPPERSEPTEAFSPATFLEQQAKEVEEYVKANMTPELKEFIRRANEETERWEREESGE